MLTENQLLYGREEPIERIVGLHEYGDDAMKVYRRTEDDEVAATTRPFRPWLLASETGLNTVRDGLSDSAFDWDVLEGEGKYQHLISFNSTSDFWDTRRRLTDYAGYGEFHAIPELKQQFLMRKGLTLFQGMSLDDVHRMQFDIEAYDSTGQFTQASRAADKVIIISLSDNRGWERVLHIADEDYGDDRFIRLRDETELLQEFVRYVQRRDPDVLEGHNVFGYDLPYLKERCSRHNVSFALGRDGKEPRSWTAKKDFAEREVEVEYFDIHGRSIIDTWFLALDYDVYKRDLPGTGLKEVAQHFGVAPEDRVYIEGSEIARYWDEDPETLLSYALHDVQETLGVANHLSDSTFYLTQKLPTTYQGALTAGTASTIQLLMLRGYLRERTAVPSPEKGATFPGGLTECLLTGVYDNLLYADIESLYPNIMLHYDVNPESDELGLFPKLLRHLTDSRLYAKALMKEARQNGNEERAAELDAQQSSDKILINSFYGALGFKYFLWNDMKEAERVTETGQKLLRRMKEIIEDMGGTVVEMDTDGILFVPPHGDSGEGRDLEMIEDISERMPEGINVGFDGRFERMLSYKAKNYILRDYDGKVKIKGGSFKNRSVEPFGRDYVKEVALALLDRDVAKVREIHERYKRRIVNKEIPAKGLAKSKTLKKSIPEYEASLEGEHNYPIAQYELAIEREEETGVPAKKGDIVEYYVAGNTKAYKLRTYEAARLLDDYEEGSENVDYYLKRLKTFAEKFEVFFTELGFEKVFNMDVPDGTGDLFGLDGTELDDVKVVNKPADNPTEGESAIDLDRHGQVVE